MEDLKKMMFQVYGSSNFFQTLRDWGFVDAFLPFALLFVLFFAVLIKINIFEERKINGLLAFLLSAMIVVPHVLGIYPPEVNPILLIMQFLPHTGVLLLAVLCVLLLLGLAGGEYPSWMTGLVGLVAAGILAFVILSSILPGFFWWIF